MSMMKFLRAVMIAVMVLAGCRRGTRETAVDEAEVMQAAETVILHTLETENRTAAISEAREMLTHPEYEPARSTILQWFLRLHLEDDRLGAAQRAYLELAADDPQLAVAGFEMMLQASAAEGLEAGIAWLERLLAEDEVPDVLRLMSWKQRLAAYAEKAEFVPLAERVPVMLADEAVASQALDLLNFAITRALAAKDLEGAGALLAAVAQAAIDAPELLQVVYVQNGPYLMQTGQLEAAYAHMQAHAEPIGDGLLSRQLQRLLNAAEAQDRQDLVNRVVSAVYDMGTQYPVTLDTVGGWMVRRAAGTGKAEPLLAESRMALQRDVSVSRVFHAFSSGFYALIQTSNPQVQQSIDAFIGEMRQRDDVPESLRASMALLALDCAFFMGDYRAALAVIEQGVAGHDEEWHTEVKEKVLAHLAQQEGRYEEAIALYQRHIDRVSKWEEPVTNPEDGSPVHKEVLLGLNEKRIGDLWKNVPERREEAAAAYARAMVWYRKALALLEPESVVHARVESELASLEAALLGQETK